MRSALRRAPPPPLLPGSPPPLPPPLPHSPQDAFHPSPRPGRVEAVRLTQRAYDHHDIAPEDRTELRRLPGTAGPPQVPFHGFGMYEALVRGSVEVSGVNYARYEGGGPSLRRQLSDALRDDLICEVGNGVRRDDVALRVLPGEISSVVLHYEHDRAVSPMRHSADGHNGQLPLLYDAEWSMRVDYVIRAKDPARQRNIARALVTALAAPEGLTPLHIGGAYGQLTPDAPPRASPSGARRAGTGRRSPSRCRRRPCRRRVFGASWRPRSRRPCRRPARAAPGSSHHCRPPTPRHIGRRGVAARIGHGLGGCPAPLPTSRCPHRRHSP